MPDLNFEVTDALAPAYAAVPMLLFKLDVRNSDAQDTTRIHSVALRCQVQIAATRRRYSRESQARLVEVFGEPHRWSETLKSLLWTHTSVVVPQFTQQVTVDMPIACTYDFEVVATKYFDAVEDGDIPLTFLFSGTIFYEGEGDSLLVSQIPWSKEATYRMPKAIWQHMIDHYYPHSAWIRVDKDVFDQLFRYKTTRGIPTWDEAMLSLLRTQDEEVQR